jgi:hypothetical protein
MDLQRFISVAWRFKLLLAIGLVLATLLAVMSVAKIGSGGLSYRQPQVFTSASTLFVTQDGFPWGRAILDDVITIEPPGGGEPTVVPRFADPGRYSGLAALYAELAKGDAVRTQVMKNAGPGEHYTPVVAQTPGSSSSLPLIYMQGFGPSPEAAQRIANRASEVFQDYLEREQRQSRIDPTKRVEVTVTQRATRSEVFEGRSFVRPIFLFLLVMMAFLALAFGLENLHRSRRAKAERESWDDEALWRPPDAQDAEQPVRVG